MNVEPNDRREGKLRGRQRDSVGKGRRMRDESKDELTLTELREIIARRRVPLIASVLLGALVGLLVTLEMPRRFEAVSRISVNYAPTTSSGVEALAQAAGVVDPTTLETQVTILNSDSLAWEVIRTLRLDQKVETLPRPYPLGPTVCQSAAYKSFESIGAECRRMLLDEFHKRLHVQAVPRTEILETRFRCKSRYLAEEVIDTLSTLYIERNFQAKYQSATKNSAWLAGQLDGVRKDADEAAHKLIAYQEKTGETGLEAAPNLTFLQLTGLSQQLIASEGERIVREARYRTAQSGDPEAMVALSQGSTLQLLHSEEAMLENQYAEAESQFGDSYPKVIQLKDQLQAVHESMKAELARTTEKLRSEYEAAVKAEEMLRAQVAQQKQLAFNSTEAGVEMSLLNRDMEASGELYKQVVKRLKTGGILAAGNGPDITVIDPASTPLRRAEPNTTLNLLAGTFAGLLVGLALCGIFEVLDTRNSTLKDVSELCPLSGVGIVPLIQEGRNAPRSLSEVLDEIESRKSNPEVTNAFRSIRTSLLHADGANPPQIVLVTSPMLREGAAAASAHLAIALAQLNRRVLLIDANLRDRQDDVSADAHQARGLTEALKNEDYRAFIQPHLPSGSLRYLPSGCGSSNPADLLDSPRMRELVTQWRGEFDHVIIHVPELMTRSEATLISMMADTVLLAVRVGPARRRDVEESIEILDSVGARLHGALVTDLNEHGLLARIICWQDKQIYGQRKVNRHASL